MEGNFIQQDIYLSDILIFTKMIALKLVPKVLKKTNEEKQISIRFPHTVFSLIISWVVLFLKIFLEHGDY